MTGDLQQNHNQREQPELLIMCPKAKLSRAVTVFIELLLTRASLRSVLECETSQRIILLI